MNIGVDAGALSITDDRLKVGVYRVVVNLLIELGKQDKTNTYRLYSFRPLEQGMMRDFGSRMTNVVLPQKGWFRFWLPLELQRNPVDVFLGLSQALPFSTNYSIGFVYDVGFLRFPEAYPGSYESLKKQTESLVKQANKIITISQTTAQDLVKFFGVDKNKLTVAYPGVSKLLTARGKKFKSPRPYFLFVGALNRGKNIPTLLKAFALFNTKTKEQYDLLLIGGDYWFDTDIVPAAHVKRLGYVPDDELANYYRGAKALVMPSLWEGFCLPVVEAMASGCPVIVSRAGALPEIVGNAGILVDPMDVEGFANAMQEKISGAKGIVRSKVYSWERMAQSVLCEIY